MDAGQRGRLACLIRSTLARSVLLDALEALGDQRDAIMTGSFEPETPLLVVVATYILHATSSSSASTQVTEGGLRRLEGS